ncbi:CehA/McbA family metallohydrolase [Botrimarina sp.]|uniref:CehA/McbA family metallohydrolase n=1 Tax=Botrimarina sp. TaxID=2795802 RepID=UPI0032EBD1AA
MTNLRSIATRVAPLAAALACVAAAVAHPGHFGPHTRVVAKAESPDSAAASKEPAKRPSSEADRQRAFFAYELLTDVALRCPTPSQAFYLDQAEADHKLVNGAGVDADQRRRRREQTMRRLASEIKPVDVSWTAEGPRLSESTDAIEVARSLPRCLLVRVTNQLPDAAIRLAARADRPGHPFGVETSILPGDTAGLLVQLTVDDPSAATASVELQQRDGAAQAYTLKIPVQVVEPAVVRGVAIDGDSGKPWPARVYALGPDHQYRRGERYKDLETLSRKELLRFWQLGKFYQLPFFYCDGSFEVVLPPGEVELTIERGFEHEPVTQRLTLRPGETRDVRLESGRFCDMKSRGWVSGDTHVHWVINQWDVDLPLDLLSVVQRAEDVRVANNLTLLQRGSSKAFITPNQAPMGPVESHSDEQYHVEMGEEYRNEDLYGHLCFLNLDWLVMPIGTGSLIAGPDALDYPTNRTAILSCREQGGISIEAHGLGGNKDVPVNVVHGLTDSLDQMPVDEYYRFLDCGFRLPLTNGSDHPARVVGCARAYVRVDGEFTYDKWIEGVRQCRTFTTSGPLLFLEVNGAEIGDTLRVDADEPLTITARAESRRPIDTLQIVSNGEVLATKHLDAREGEVSVTIPAGESRWVVARCGPPGQGFDAFNAIQTPEVAHTSAIYVDVDGRSRFVPDAASTWIERMTRHIEDIRSKGRFANAAQREEAISYVEDGIRQFEELIAAAAAGAPLHSVAMEKPTATGDQEPKKIVLIPTALDHPWATHMYRRGCELLAACLNQNPGVEAVVSPDDDWPKDPSVLEGVDAIAFYSRPAGDLLLAPAHRDEALELMNAGVGLAAIHWSTGTSDDQFGPQYLDLLGGWFSFAHSGLKVDRQTLEQAAPDHPVCNGWSPFPLRDEFYLNLKFKDSAKPVLTVEVDGVEQTVAWAYERPGGGRSFGTTLAHFHDNFAIDEFRRAVVNGLLWAAGAEVPAGGADVSIPSRQLELPDAPPAASDEPKWPSAPVVERQPLLLQVDRLVEALDYIGNPVPQSTRDALRALRDERDDEVVTSRVQELLDPLCLAGVRIADGKIAAAEGAVEPMLVEQGWRSFLVKVCNDARLTTRLHVESPNARSMPHSKAEDVASRWLGLTTYDGRPLQASLSGLPLEYRVVQIYSRDAGPNEATLEFSIDAEPGARGRLVREWRFDEGTDGWQEANQIELEARDGSLWATGQGSDPFLSAEVGGASGDLLLRFWAEAEEDGICQVFFWTEEQPEPDPNKAVTIPLMPGAAQQYEAAIKVDGVLAGVRIDPNVKASRTRFDWIDLSYAHRRGETWTSLPLRFDAEPAVQVAIEVVDKHPEAAAAAFIVRDKLGRIYPEQSKRLAPDLFFQPQVYRLSGETIDLPPGEYDVEAWRGPESIRERRRLVVGEQGATLRHEVRRWIDPADYGWWSGDHHIHAAGCLHYQNPTQGVHPPDMMRQIMGEDLHVGCCLTWGPCFDYQKRFFTGDDHDVMRYPYVLRYDVEVSGFGSHASGHLNLLRLKQQIYPGGESKDHWPTLGLQTLRWAKAQDAVTGTAHSGAGLTRYIDRLGVEDGPHGLPHYNIPAYDGIGANEFVVDVTHELPGADGQPKPALDFIATMNTPRRDEWNMWYHVLNCGYRVRASGETDFPCMSGERVGIGRVYVKVDGRLNYPDWVQGLQDGRSYVSDALVHLMDFQAEASGQTVRMGEEGSELRLAESGRVRFAADCAALLDADALGSPDAAEVEVELIVNGYPAATKPLPADGEPRRIEFDVDVPSSAWVALRVFPHAHTNPIFVVVDGRPIRASKASAEWCLRGVDQCWQMKRNTYAPAEQDAALAAYEHARQAYRRIVQEADE